MGNQASTAFYADNSKTKSDFNRIAFDVIRSIDVTPITYVNCIRSLSSSPVDVELRNDFYKASFVILFFCPVTDGWFSPEHHWCYDEYLHLVAPCLVYLAPRISEENNLKFCLPTDKSNISIKYLNELDSFRQSLERDLKSFAV